MVLLGGNPRRFCVGVQRRTPSTPPPKQEKAPAPVRGPSCGGNGGDIGLDLQFMSLSKRWKF